MNKLIDLIKMNELRLIRIDFADTAKAELTDKYGQSWDIKVDFPVDEFELIYGYASVNSLQLDCQSYLMTKGA